MIQNNSIDLGLLADIRGLIDQTKAQVAVTVNSAMTLMYWHIGDRINRELLGGERAAYGKQIVAKLAEQLTNEYGRGYDSKSLRHMMRFATVFPDIQIVSPLVRQLSWSHFLQVMAIEDDLARNFYLTKLPERKLIEQKLQQAIQRAHNQLSNRPTD